MNSAAATPATRAPRRETGRAAFSALAVVLLASAPASATPPGTIYSGAAAADPMAVYWNPAAMTQLDDTTLLADVNLVFASVNYRRSSPAPTGRHYPPADMLVFGPIPAVGLVTDFGLDRFRFGIGVAAPLTEGINWKKSYGGLPASTRYYGIEGTWGAFLIEPSAAYRINRYISIGAGVDIIAMLLESQLMVDFGAQINHLVCQLDKKASCSLNTPLAREDPRFDAEATVGGLGWGVGVFGGVLVSPTRWLHLGMGVHSGSLNTISIPSSLDVKLPPTVTNFVQKNLPTVTLPELHADTSLQSSVPMIITAGLALRFTRWQLGLDFQWIDRSTQSVIQVTVHERTSDLLVDKIDLFGLRDAFDVALRGAWRVLPSLRIGARLGFHTNTRPEEFTQAANADWNRIRVRIGAAWRPTRWLTLLLTYTHTFLLDTVVKRSLFRPNPSPTTPEEEALDRPDPSGVYGGQINQLALGTMFHF